ncbi:MAG: HIT family protein [bacterium]|nr:HIT family protein [bacterium]
MEDSVFTKIIKGEIPCHKVYEDDFSLAFMDIHPIQPGHVTVVSKLQVANFYELPSAEYDGFWRAVRKVAEQLKSAYQDKKKIAVQVEGLEVEHVHAKLFPFNNAHEFHNRPEQSEPDHDQLAKTAEKLRIEE